MKTSSILTVMLLGLGTASLIAQDAPGNRPRAAGQRPAPEEMFKRLDKNGDGKIAKDEASERLAQNFDKIDANKDGFITIEELKAGRPAGGDAPRRPRAGADSKQ